MVINILIILHQNLLDDGLYSEIEKELSAFSGFTSSLDWPSHFLHDFFTNGKTKPGSLLISMWVLIKFTEIYEQIIEALFWYTYASVFNTQAETDETLLATQNFWTIVW